MLCRKEESWPEWPSNRSDYGPVCWSRDWLSMVFAPIPTNEEIKEEEGKKVQFGVALDVGYVQAPTIHRPTSQWDLSKCLCEVA